MKFYNLGHKTFETDFKIYQWNFQSSCRLAQLFLDTSAVILQKKSEIVGENFSSSENAIWSILLKYYALINRECGPYAKIFVATSCRTDRKK